MNRPDDCTLILFHGKKIMVACISNSVDVRIHILPWLVVVFNHCIFTKMKQMGNNEK